jgi:ADP-ribose pyrophosphatase YjhB (NUDIX family)
MKQFPTHIVAVNGIIENDMNQIILVKSRYHDTYNLPGGQVEVGENLIEALMREIKEEAGVNVTVDQLISVSSNTCTYEGFNGYGIVPTKVILGFTCTYVSGELITSDETSETIWVIKDQILDYVTSPYMIERMKEYVNHTNGIQFLQYVNKPEYELILKREI